MALAEPLTDPLDRLLVDARALYESDLWVDNLVQQAPPVTVELRTGVLREEPAARIGMTVSGRLLRLLGHPDGYGAQHPWLHALYRLGWYCRGNHLGHDEQRAWRGTLCGQLVRLTVVHQVPVGMTCQVLALEPDRTRPVLSYALRWIEADIDSRRRDAERREKIERDHHAGEGLVTLFDRQHQVERQQRMWERLRIRHPYLSEWQTEFVRRRAFHAEKGCPGCPLLDTPL